MAEEQKAPEFSILRVYNKDISLETPNLPQIFKEEFKPETNLDLDIKNTLIDENEKIYEVVLRITVTAKMGEEVGFLCEVNQAGLFHIDNLAPEQLDGFLNAFIPGVLYPYARETISSLVNRATFPPLILAPINFDALYQQRKAKEAADAQEAAK